MANTTTIDRTLSDYRFIKDKGALVVSDLCPVADDIILDVETSRLDIAWYAHCFASIQFFQTDGITPATPTAGTYTITVKSWNNSPTYESPPANVITAATPHTMSWAANTYAVRVVSTVDASGGSVSKYRLYVTANRD